MFIRQYTESDKIPLVTLWTQVFPNDPPHNEPSSMIEAKLKVDDLIFVAEYEGKIVGAMMAGYDGHRGWLYAVAVLEEYRRHGVGEQLVNRSMSVLKAKGCIKVNLQIRADNYQVATFYKSLGFQVEERMSMGLFL